MCADQHRNRHGQRQARRSPKPPRNAAGFTLVELLVSLVILGFVMSLVSQAIFQVAQVTRAADATTRSLAARWGAGWTASSMFANLLAPELDKLTPVLRGSATRIDGFTSLPLDGAGTGIAPFGLLLAPAAGTADQTEMRLLAAPDSTSATSRSSLIAAFPGRAEFAFVDRQGRQLADWPASTRSGLDPEDLPKAVLVRETGGGAILMWYGFPGETMRQQRQVNPFVRPAP